MQQFFVNRPSVLASFARTVQHRSKIYTRTGDAGTSAVFTGERRAKDDVVFHSLGATDELSSFLGLAAAALPVEKNVDLAALHVQLEDVQCRLQDLGSLVATPDPVVRARFKLVDVTPEHVVQLERWIDSMDSVLPPLRVFILPGGTPASAALHVARSVCRRAERTLVPLVAAGALSPPAYKYVNRLSDYLFTAARFCAHAQGTPDVKYTAPKSSSTAT